MIKERYCSPEVSRLLREKGFNEECHHVYVDMTLEEWTNTLYGNDVLCNNEIPDDNVIATPTHQMVCDWLMARGIYICPKYCCFQEWKKNAIPYFKWEPTILSLTSSLSLYPQPLDRCEHFDTFGEAVDFCIKFSLENLI